MGDQCAGQWQGDRHRDFRNTVLAAMRAPAPAAHWLLITAVGTAASAAATLATAATGASGGIKEVRADPPSDLMVTVYRAPYRQTGSIDLDSLEGFALVSETRLVHIPPGISRVRFEGVADGIEPVSALVTGLPGTVIEKNRDAKLLSPSALLAASVGKPVELLRTNRKTGKTERRPGMILSDAGGGIVFKTDQGIEALRCSGLPETFSFEPMADLSARPTLSVEVRSPTAVTQQVTLSYLARGFDWAANYTADVSADGSHLALGAWVTLANSNGVGFPSARTQVVAGKVNHQSGDVEPIDIGGPVLAQCWPRGSTSDFPMILALPRSRALNGIAVNAPAPMAAMRSLALQEVVVTGAKKVQQEQLGDLKLYRVPERTTLASRQSKQVRLMDLMAIPVTTIYQAEFAAGSSSSASAQRLLRTKNTRTNHLGLPLPSGSVAVFSERADERLLQHESGIRDIAVDEEVEIDAGDSPDVQVAFNREASWVEADKAKELPLVPGVILRSINVDTAQKAEVTNGGPHEIQFELKVLIDEGARIVRADHPVAAKNGTAIFQFKVPANQTVTVRFQTQSVKDRILRTP
jgi:hypothetical protein